jgi:uncharacterized protein YuzE
MNLRETLPELAADVEGVLVRLGRGKVADALRAATLADWAFDDFAATTYLRMAPARDASAVAERISLFDDIGVDVDIDAAGRIVGLEVSGYEHVLARLGKEGR